MKKNPLSNYVPDGDCKRCKVRKNCLASCGASQRRADRLKAEEEQHRRMIQKALLTQIDKNNESFREGLERN